MNACVIIQISGKRTERLLERMRLSGIAIFALSRPAPQTVELTLSTRDFKRLHLLARGSACSIHIVQRIGRAFALQRLFRRYALWISSLVLILCLFTASTRILWIDVDGCSRVAEQTVLRALKEQGIQIGVSNSGLDFPTLSDRLRVYDARIAWVGLALDGVILRVSIVEAISTTDETDPNAPASVFAQKSGLITDIEADAGRAAVSVGDRVEAGDLLISGDLTREDSQYPVYAHAAGRVLAQIAYIGEAIAESTETQLADTGNAIPYRQVLIAGYPLFTTDIPYANYELRDISESTATDILLPLRVLDATCYEQQEQTITRTAEEMTEAALYEAEQFAWLKVPKDAAVTDKQAAWVKTGGQILGVVTILTEESIGFTKEIEFDGTNGQQPDEQPVERTDEQAAG